MGTRSSTPARRRRRAQGVTAAVTLAVTLAVGTSMAGAASTRSPAKAPDGGATGPRSQVTGPRSHGAGSAGLRRSSAAGPATETVKICEDPTTSSPPAFIQQFVQEVAAGVGDWAPAAVAKPPSSAVAAVPGLTVWVRAVGTDAFATDQTSLEVQVPAVPALPAPPRLTDPTLAVDQLAWSKREAGWARQVQAARAAARQAAAAIVALPLDQSPDNYSGIWQCLAALADSGVQDRSTRLLIGSDLTNNEALVGADYRGSPVLIDQSCPAGNLTSCPSLAQQWVAQLHGQGAGPVTVVRSDAAAQAVEQWIIGGRS